MPLRPAFWQSVENISAQSAKRMLSRQAAGPGQNLLCHGRRSQSSLLHPKGYHKGSAESAQPGEGLIIVDCGGGTIDVSAYDCKSHVRQIVSQRARS